MSKKKEVPQVFKADMKPVSFVFTKFIRHLVMIEQTVLCLIFCSSRFSDIDSCHAVAISLPRKVMLMTTVPILEEWIYLYSLLISLWHYYCLCDWEIKRGCLYCPSGLHMDFLTLHEWDLLVFGFKQLSLAESVLVYKCIKNVIIPPHNKLLRCHKLNVMIVIIILHLLFWALSSLPFEFSLCVIQALTSQTVSLHDVWGCRKHLSCAGSVKRWGRGWGSLVSAW